ncbi:RNA polymerase sigma-70 factor [Chitinophagaceae bacterium LWZ2-11]
MEVNDLYKQFQLLFEQFYNPLCKYAFSYIKRSEICEDIVQDVFARIWENRKDLIKSDAIRYYLFTAVRNNCLTHLTREQRMAFEGLNENELSEHDHYGENGIELSDSESVNYQALLEEGIAQLPAKCKEIFLLNRMGHLSNQQIADELNVSVKTVNNQLWKAMKMLRAFGKKIKFWWILAFLNFF